MMKRSNTAALVVGAAICASATTYVVTARAFGIPEGQATPTLVYSGTLFENGLPLTRPVPIEVALFSDQLADGDVPLCTTGAGVEITPDASGAFSIALPASCTGVVGDNAALFVQVDVDGRPIQYNINGSSVTRVPIAAVPFAVEARNAEVALVAQRATANDGLTIRQELDELRARIEALEANASP